MGTLIYICTRVIALYIYNGKRAGMEMAYLEYKDELTCKI